MTRMFQNQKFVSGTLTLLLLLTACGDAAPSGDPGQTSRLFLPTDRPENVTEPTVETDA